MSTHFWQPIETAPKDVKIDILARYWVWDSDKFEFRRFPDCRWSQGDTMTGIKPYWSGLDKGWRAVGWMPLPPMKME